MHVPFKALRKTVYVKPILCKRGFQADLAKPHPEVVCEAV